MADFVRLALYAKLLMAAQKNVLLVGAPGVGKTRLARALSTGLEPLVVVGRDGLSYDKLVAYYAIDEDRKPRFTLGELSKAVTASWIGIGLGLGPRYVVFDEINRCNADVLLGEAFTAMDIEHRMSVPVVRGEAFKHVMKLLEEASSGNPEPLLDELGLREALDASAGDLRGVAEKLRSFRELGGLPLPYAFRFVATMNVYDRAQLYRLGYALQRRFACLYVPPPFEEVEVEFNEEALAKLSLHQGVLNALRDPASTIAKQALRELTASESIRRSLFDADYPTAPVKTPPTDEINENLKRALKEYEQASRLVAYAYHVAEELSVELGASILVDVVKLYAISFTASPGEKPILEAGEAADLALSSIILPQLSVAVPRIRSEILVTGVEGSRSYRELSKFKESVEGVLGKRCLSVKMIEGYELPRMHRS